MLSASSSDSPGRRVAVSRAVRQRARWVRGRRRLTLWACPAAVAGVLIGMDVLSVRTDSPSSAGHAITALHGGPLLVSGALLSWRAANERVRTYAWLHAVHAALGYSLLCVALTLGTITTVAAGLCWTCPEVRSSVADWAAIVTVAVAALRTCWFRSQPFAIGQ